jgi:hypothetical protein
MVFLLTFSYLNAMPPTPLVEWEDEEIADGATSFAERIQHLLNKTVTTTAPPTSFLSPSTPSTTTGRPFVERIAHAVVDIVPQLTTAVQRELQQPTPILNPMLAPAPTPTTPSTPCSPDHVQVCFVQILHLF